MSHRLRIARVIAIVAAAALVPLTGVTAANAATAPLPITHLETYTHVGAVTFSWTLPAVSSGGVALDRTLVQAKVGLTAPATPVDGILTTPVADTCHAAEHSVHVCSPNNVTWIDGLDPGTDFTFAFFVIDTDGALSTKVTKTLHATDLSLTATHTDLTYGGTTTFKATLRGTASGGARPAVPVDFYVRAHGTRQWYFWHESKTNGSGVASTAFPPGLNLDVQAFFYGDGANLGATAGVLRINVHAKVLASVNFSARKKGKTFTIHGTVASKAPGKTAQIDRYVRGAWHKVKTVKLRGLKTAKGTTAGKVTFKVKPKAKGSYKYRITSPGSTKYLVAHSRTVKFKVT